MAFISSRVISQATGFLLTAITNKFTSGLLNLVVIRDTGNGDQGNCPSILQYFQEGAAQ